MKTIKLTDGQFKLLISLLEEAIDTRSDCGCNDVYNVYTEEVKYFTLSEIKEALVLCGGKYYLNNLKRDLGESDNFDEELKRGYGAFDTTFANYLLHKLKKK